MPNPFVPTDGAAPGVGFDPAKPPKKLDESAHDQLCL